MSQPLSVILVHREPSERSQLRVAFEATGLVKTSGERPDLRGGPALGRQGRPARPAAR